jgi:hypothetical protein
MRDLKRHAAYGLLCRGYRKVRTHCGLVLPWTRFSLAREMVTCGNCRRILRQRRVR